MNTIYDGTYVIGNTNELTFSAGPGIKIDSPSAGTVRIGNDETVLYSTNTNGSSACPLSEPISAFDRIKIEYRYGQIHEYKAFTGVKAFADNIFTDFSTAPQNCFFQLQFSGTQINVPYGYQVQYAGFSNPTTATSIVNAGSTYSKEIIKRIWGINRISGNA